MNVIILGAGVVGASLAESLCGENNDVCVIDRDEALLGALSERLDIRPVQGHVVSPETLANAGADSADLVIAVTGNDEVNIVACQVAHHLFNVRTKISRVRTGSYRHQPRLFSDSAIPIDVIIHPEQLVTDHIHRLLDHPGALQVLDFAGGTARMVGMRATEGGPMVGRQVREIRQHVPRADVRIAAIYRQGQAIQPTGTTEILDGDEVFFIAARQNIRALMDELRQLKHPYRRVFIGGGGGIGGQLCRDIEDVYQVRLIERDMQRCEELSQQMDQATIVHGSATDRVLLEKEDIRAADVFIAVTNDDGVNIMSSLVAHSLGNPASPPTTMSLVTNNAFIDLHLLGPGIDISILPAAITTSSILAHVRTGHVVTVHSLHRGAAEAFEAVARDYGERHNLLVGQYLGEVRWPEGSTVGAIVRDEQVIIAHKSVRVKDGDHVIVFVLEKSHLDELERLFLPKR